MTRHNFSAKTRRLAFERSEGRCEAVGAVYNLAPGERCKAEITLATMDADHYPLPAHVEGSNKLDNAIACCKACHSWKTRHFDILVEAKIKRILRRDGKIPDKRKHPPRKIPSRPFPKRGATK